jgi:hypothetical protein
MLETGLNLLNLEAAKALFAPYSTIKRDPAIHTLSPLAFVDIETTVVPGATA